MNRMNSVAGPGGILSFLTLAWLAAGGVALAWFATAGPTSGFRGLVALLAGRG